MNLIAGFKTYLTVLLCLPWLLCSCADEENLGDSDAVPAVYIVDKSGEVVATFGYKGSFGRPCRMSHPDLRGEAICKYESEEPIQSAINWAKSSNLNQVYLDDATYTFTDTQSSYRGKVAIYIPSSIHLRGVVRDGVPVSVITPSSALVEAAAANPSAGYDITVLAAGSLSDPFTPLTDTSVETVFIDNKFAGAVCLWAGGGSGFRLMGVHSQGSQISSLIVGDWTREEDPLKPYTSKICYNEGFEISGCRVYDADGDAIAVIGRNGRIHDNVCRGGTSEFDNGVTAFIGSDNIEIDHNDIAGYPCGIGLDGTFMTPVLAGKTEAESAVICIARDKELYSGSTGYNTNFKIHDNTARECKRGIVLFRASGMNIFGNEVSDCHQEGIGLEEAIGNRVWGNAVTGCSTACRLYAHKDSAVDALGQTIGTAYNMIGYDLSNHPQGNDFRNNAWGFSFEIAHELGKIHDNTFAANDITGCPGSDPLP